MRKAILVVAIFLAYGIRAGAQNAQDSRLVLLQAMWEEMNRSMRELRLEDFEPPYFVAMECKEDDRITIMGRYAALTLDERHRTRTLRSEVRVGSYEFDNIGEKGEEFDFSETPTYFPDSLGPLDTNPLALRNALWLLTDSAYKNALKNYLKRKSKKITEVEDGKKKASFTKEKPILYTQPPRNLAVNLDYWRNLVREMSAEFKHHPRIFDSSVSFEAKKFERLLVNSEGTRIVSNQIIYSLSVFGATRAPDGMLLRHTRTVHAQSDKKLPDKQAAMAMVQQVAKNLEDLAQAPVLEPYTGPAILDGEATGVLFHEVIGHRLEGERQLDEREGKTFKEQIGRQIIPEFLSVYDDPTLSELGGEELNGHYAYDDEGVAAQRVVLVERGVLRNFLLSRTPVEGFTNSNGHGRADAGKKPRARMAVTIVKSEREVPYARLKEMLIEEVKRQNKPYGLIIKNIVGGATHTYTWGYQAYKGIPEMVYRVYPDGREELVRGVEIVGTPIASINKILATSNNYKVFNGFCGAESGFVPVSTYAPDVLMAEIELQRKMVHQEKPPILPSPWNGKNEK